MVAGLHFAVDGVVEAVIDRACQMPAHLAVMIGQDGDPKMGAPCKSGQVLEVRATENETSGGSRLTLVNELAASPVSRPSTSAATVTTPVGKTPNALHSRAGSRSWLV